MSERRDLLVEIGTEELPPKALRRLSEAFAENLGKGLDKAGIAHGDIEPYGAPRRLAVLVREVAARQPDKTQERKGPALAAAFDEEGCPTQAALGFARSCGTEVEQLQTLESPQGAWLVWRSLQHGRATKELMPALVEEALAGLPIPKRMRWGSSRAEFVRPVHWVVLLLGEEVIEGEILGLPTGRETRGHRFHHPAPLLVSEPRAYAPLLETEGRVMADFGARREAVRAQVKEVAARIGGRAVIDEALLDEVTGMVEWPVALAGTFEERFLEVPAEALISSMKSHQKYFHVVDEAGRLLPHFITVSNIESRQADVVREGNERVIRPRLTDAAFFWEQDRKRPLAERLDDLKSVVFQQRLGSLHDKARRVAALAAGVAARIGGETALAERAGLLAKCDLLTDMVGEFPELQGIMGRYYARADGESAAVATALDEQYMPRYAGDQVAQTPTGQALAIADKIDTLVGIFGIGQPPSGDKDPFALRRAALGVLRTVIEGGLAEVSLPELLAEAVRGYAEAFPAGQVAEQCYDFMMERLRTYYDEAGVAGDTFQAVLALRPERPGDFDARLRAVTAFRALPEAEALAAANKRIGNILRQAGDEVGQGVDQALLQEDAERRLAAQVAAMAAAVRPLLDERRYEDALKHMAGLREAVDSFFDQVMVMADDAAVRRNRLALLAGLRALFYEVADLSVLQHG